jgi:hypothetical protein
MFSHQPIKLDHSSRRYNKCIYIYIISYMNSWHGVWTYIPCQSLYSPEPPGYCIWVHTTCQSLYSPMPQGYMDSYFLPNFGGWGKYIQVYSLTGNINPYIQTRINKSNMYYCRAIYVEIEQGRVGDWGGKRKVWVMKSLPLCYENNEFHTFL